MLERWNDEKMDALAGKVSDVDVRLARVEVKVDEGFKEIKADLAEQRTEFSALQRTMIMATVGIVGTFVTGFGILVGLVVAMQGP